MDKAVIDRFAISIETARVREAHVFDTAFCGGRWPASLMAEMAEAEALNG